MAAHVHPVATLQATYVLPIRCSRPGSDMADLTSYLRRISRLAELVIVDGSDDAIFESNHALWSSMGSHVRPHAEDACLNGKAWGVRTGLRLATNELVVVADDDVRYDATSFDELLRSLTHADLVRPQNYFDPLPWHAAWDTARTLLNRAFGSDHPGTLGLRRSTFFAHGGYDGDVLFENLEMVRTIRSAEGTVVDRPDLFVRRLPPTARHFWSQRVRQAYDDLAQPARLVAFLCVLPGIAVAIATHRELWLLPGMIAIVVAAAVGRHKANGTHVFAPHALCFVPLWVVERATCSWIAIVRCLARGGIPYAGRVIARAASSPRALRAQREADRAFR